MSPRRIATAARRTALAVLATPLLLSCWGDLVTNDSLGTLAVPSAGARYQRYVAMGTSIGAGIQSGGINDSTQKQAYPYLLASAMGLRPGVNWLYPSLTKPGCPPPFTNPLTNARVTPAGFPTSTGASCYVRTAASAAPLMNNVSIPGLRIQQVLDLTAIPFGATDTLKLAGFLTGGVNPIDMAERGRPTFVTLEVFANDALGAATRGDTTLLTSTADFQAAFTAIANRLDATGASVAVMNLPSGPLVPHFSPGFLFYCLKNGCPALGINTAAPFTSANFTVDPSCNHPALSAGVGVGDSTLVPFATTGAIAGTLTAGGLASLDCTGGGAATTTPASATPLAVVGKPEMRAIFARIAEFNNIIATEATARDWALADWNAALVAQAAAGKIPLFPSLATPTTTLFGTIFSLDGIHPNLAGQRIIAQAFATAIRNKWGTNLTIP